MNEYLAEGQRPRRSPKSSLNVIRRPIDLLKPDPANARSHSKTQIRQIARSIETFGFNVPVLVDADLQVLAGHGRLLAARRLGLSDVPTIRLEHLTPAQARAFVIADNRLAEIATWDDRLLGEQLHELSELDLDFSLDVTGFEIGEIDLLIEGAAPQADPDDAVPRPQAGRRIPDQLRFRLNGSRSSPIKAVEPETETRPRHTCGCIDQPCEPPQPLDLCKRHRSVSLLPVGEHGHRQAFRRCFDAVSVTPIAGFPLPLPDKKPLRTAWASADSGVC